MLFFSEKRMYRMSHLDAGKPGRVPPPHHGRASPLPEDENYEEQAQPHPSERVNWQSPAMTEVLIKLMFLLM